MKSFAAVLVVLLPSAASSLRGLYIRGIRPALPKTSWAHQSAEQAGVEIAVASESKGLGAFATRSIKFGDYLGAYSGEKLTQEEVKARFWGRSPPDQNDLKWIQSRLEREQGITGSYLFEMKDGYFVCAEDARVSSWCRFMNHAAEGTPECNVKAFDRISPDGELEEFPQMYAIRDIEEGEELGLWTVLGLCIS
jgi:SET domain-containing protein